MSWPSRRPPCRIAPGVPPIRKIRFCIFSGPRSSSSMVVMTVPFLHVRVVHQLLDVVHRGERGAGVLEGGGDLLVVGRAPIHSATGASIMSACLTRSPALGNQDCSAMSGPADQVHDPLRDRGGAGRDGHPPAVSGQVGVAGGVVAGPVAVPAGDDPELVVDAGSGAEDADQRFQQGQVDDLPAAAWRRPGGTGRASPRRRRSGRRPRRPARTAAASAVRSPPRSGGPGRSSPRPGCRTRGAWRTARSGRIR